MKPQSLSNSSTIAGLYNQDLTNTANPALLLPYPCTATWEKFPNTTKYLIQDGSNTNKKVPYQTVKQKEPWRHLAILGDDLTGIITEAPSTLLINYWRDQFGHKYNNMLLLNESNYCAEINRKKLKVITLFPYDHIEKEQHLVDPDLHYYLLGKSALTQMGVQTPQQRILQISELETNQLPYPYILKTNHGLSGDGTFIIQDADSLKKTLLTIHEYGLSEVIFQEYIVAKKNYGLQFYVNKKGEITIMGYTEQLTDTEGHYQGSIIKYEQSELKKFMGIIQKVGHFLFQKGYFGIAGLDILENNDDELYIIDGNFRLTGGTPQYLLKSYFIEAQQNAAKFSTEYSFKGSIDKCLQTFYPELNRKILTILSAVEIKGKTEIYGITSGKSIEDLTFNEKYLSKKGLILTS